VAEQSDGKQAPGGEERGGASAREAVRERRASHRVRDDQQTGQGSLSALSKLKMLERKRAQLRLTHDED
jgi:hypothetical protein